MRTAFATCASLLFLAVTVTAATATAEAARDAALGQAGEVYIATGGLCSALFTGCPATLAEHPVVALDVRRSGEPIQRLLLPDTEGQEAEGIPTLVYENSTSSLFVVWEGKYLDGHSRVNLVWLRDGVWSEVIEITGDVLPLKGSPQLVVTRDSYEVRAADGTMSAQGRTVLHVTWWERGSLVDEVYYTPIFIDGGAFIGTNRVYNLTSMDPSPAPSAPLSLPADLQRTPRIEPGRDGRSVVIGFVNARTQRFLTFESQVIAGHLSGLGDEMARFIVDHGSLYDSEPLATFADRIRAHIVELGYHFHPALTTFLADGARTEVIAAADPNSGVLALAERIRAHIVELGLHGLASIDDFGGTTASQAVVLETPAAGSGATSAHGIGLQLVSTAPAPSVGTNGPYWFVLSPDGKRAVVSWPSPGSLHYRELDEEGWSAERSLEIEGPVDAARAEQILRQRVREL